MDLQTLEDKYIAKLSELSEDKERAHCQGDDLIVDLLKELGMVTLSEAYKQRTEGWWYA